MQFVDVIEKWTLAEMSTAKNYGMAAAFHILGFKTEKACSNRSFIGERAKALLFAPEIKRTDHIAFDYLNQLHLFS